MEYIFFKNVCVWIVFFSLNISLLEIQAKAIWGCSMGQSEDSSVGHPKNCALYNRIKNTKHKYGGLFSFRRPQQDYSHQGGYGRSSYRPMQQQRMRRPVRRILFHQNQMGYQPERMRPRNDFGYRQPWVPKQKSKKDVSIQIVVHCPSEHPLCKSSYGKSNWKDKTWKPPMSYGFQQGYGKRQFRYGHMMSHGHQQGYGQRHGGYGPLMSYRPPQGYGKRQGRYGPMISYGPHQGFGKRQDRYEPIMSYGLQQSYGKRPSGYGQIVQYGIQRPKTYQPEKEWDEKKWAESYYDRDEKKCDCKADKHYDADQGHVVEPQVYYERYEDSPQDDPANVVIDDFLTDFSKELVVPKISKQLAAVSIEHDRNFDRREFGENDAYFTEQERIDMNEPLDTFVLVESNTPPTPLPKTTQPMEGEFRTSKFIVEKSLSPSVAESRISQGVPESKDTISDKYGISNKEISKTSGSFPATVRFNSDDIEDETSGEHEDSTQPISLETATEDDKAKYHPLGSSVSVKISPSNV